mmetsp:Transcript_43190/g.106657  ORF Transcript_43190/g.106657 Transcript_43190/m.106657 type:complete len:219 (+) Transcript_43190:49-705(+)
MELQQESQRSTGTRAATPMTARPPPRKRAQCQPLASLRRRHESTLELDELRDLLRDLHPPRLCGLQLPHQVPLLAHGPLHVAHRLEPRVVQRRYWRGARRRGGRCHSSCGGRSLGGGCGGRVDGLDIYAREHNLRGRETRARAHRPVRRDGGQPTLVVGGRRFAAGDVSVRRGGATKLVEHARARLGCERLHQDADAAQRLEEGPEHCAKAHLVRFAQ